MIGLKTKYAGIEIRNEEMAGIGINYVDKTSNVKGARISYTIWDVGGSFISNSYINVTLCYPILFYYLYVQVIFLQLIMFPTHVKTR